MNSVQAFSHNRTIAAYFRPHRSVSSSSATLAAAALGAVWIGATSRFRASQSLREASRNVSG